MRRYLFPKPYADLVQRFRVAGGFFLAAAFGIMMRPSAESFALGAPVAVLGLVARAWAAGHLAKNERLATSGPYACVRNPLYLGSLLAAAGLVIAARHPLLALIFTAVFVLVYLPVIELEEQHLRKLFPEYAVYAERVPMLWPRWPAGGAGRFSWALYARNQEYKAAVAVGIALGLLWWRGS